MNKFYFVIFLFTFTLLSGCKNEINQIENSKLVIEDFNLNHYTTNGEKLYILESPYSVYDKSNQSYSLSKTNIKFFESNNIKYIINSDKAKLLNGDKYIELNGNVEISDLKNNRTTIKSTNLTWNIDQSIFTLEGNVSLENNTINLKSSKAILDRNTNIIKFFKPVKYNYIDDNNINRYDIKSENAFYNINNKNVLFRSETTKVESKIVF